MNASKKGKRIITAIVSVLTFLLFLLFGSVSGFGRIGGACVFIFLPITVYIAMFCGETVGTVFGAVSGMFLDYLSADSAVYETVALMLAGLVAGLIVKIFINKNTLSALFLGALLSVLYFAAEFIRDGIIVKSGDMLFILTNHTVFSVIYTALFGMIPYFLMRALNKKYADA